MLRSRTLTTESPRARRAPTLKGRLRQGLRSVRLRAKALSRLKRLVRLGVNEKLCMPCITTPGVPSVLLSVIGLVLWVGTYLGVHVHWLLNASANSFQVQLHAKRLFFTQRHMSHTGALVRRIPTVSAKCNLAAASCQMGVRR